MKNTENTKKAASSKNNHTGSWREMRPEIDSSLCIGCSLCSKLCPDACIVMAEANKSGKTIAKIDYRYCKGCGLCAKECPVKAISMKKEKE
jgi:pyruvate ferredoxin oxidoreductase delta subunit